MNGPEPPVVLPEIDPLHKPKQLGFVLVKTVVGDAITEIVVVEVVVPVPFATVNEMVLIPLVA